MTEAGRFGTRGFTVDDAAKPDVPAGWFVVLDFRA